MKVACFFREWRDVHCVNIPFFSFFVFLLLSCCMNSLILVCLPVVSGAMWHPWCSHRPPGVTEACRSVLSVFFKLKQFLWSGGIWGFYTSKPRLPLGRTLLWRNSSKSLPPPYPLPPLCLGHQPDRPGELGHCHPLGLRFPLRKETRQRGHSPAAEEPDQKPPPEDRHGQQDEEDGGVAAVRGERPKEQEGHREPGTDYLWVSPVTHLPRGKLRCGSWFLHLWRK